MKINSEKVANDFLEIASEQRLNILLRLSEKKLNISKLADLLDATKPEVHRNVKRLTNTGLIEKDPDGEYTLTTYGKVVLIQIPSLSFVADNSKFFKTHTLGNLETKFIQRLGSLQDCQYTKGFVKVVEKWNKIHENAKQYVCNILSEVPYSGDIVDIISSQLQNNVQIRSIFSKSAIIPEVRKTVFEKKGFQKFVTNGLLERRIQNDVKIVVLVTDKEAALFFPNLEGETDLSEMFSSSNTDFREWCSDYFEWCWKNSTSFHELKLKD